MSQEAIFPNLSGTGYAVTSEASSSYNCVAWAAGTTDLWWWPSTLSYWPHDVQLEETLESFVLAFTGMGYETCESSDLEPGYEKVAIYVDDEATPTHMARQLESGGWTSKLGDWEDIEHPSTENLTGDEYGTVATVLRRPTPHDGALMT